MWLFCAWFVNDILFQMPLKKVEEKGEEMLGGEQFVLLSLFWFL